MNIACEGCKVLDVADVLLVVENSLIEVADAPTERNVVVEEFGELCSSLTCIGVTPGAERYQDLLLFVESHITVHHSAETDSGKSFNLAVVLSLNILAEFCIAVLESVPDSLSGVSPESIN